MIRIARGFEPPELRQARRIWLARAVLAQQRGDAPTLMGYDVARETLWERQHQKCAWCERPYDQRQQPVEHYRPKGSADRSDLTRSPRRVVPADAGYWWLAWTWENLLFGCATCNGIKLDHFPLLAGSNRATTPGSDAVLDDAHPAFDLSGELPGLVDPGRDDPTRHITWRPENPVDVPERFRWRPYDRTPEGKHTIATLKLRDWLADHVTDHLRTVWTGWLKDIVRDLLSGDSRSVTRAKRDWEQKTAMLFAPRAPLHAASWDGLRFLVRHCRIEGLVRPPLRPGAAAVEGPAEGPLDDPTLRRPLPDALRLLVHADELSTPDLMLRLYDHGVWTDAELAALLSLAPRTVQDHRRTLARAGRVVPAGAGFTRSRP